MVAIGIIMVVKKVDYQKTRTEYWLTRLEDNKKRDFFNKQKLIKLGWKVIDIWECTLNKGNIAKTFERLEHQIAV